MLYSGLVSITFREQSPKEIINLVSQAALDGIEWGGDIHVPHGNISRACEVRRMTEQAGLKVISYGSYYSVGHNDELDFERVLETAVCLGAPSIRVWAGKRSSEDADEKYWQAVIEDSRRIADLSAMAGISIVFEYHGLTLTDTNVSARKFMETVAHQNVKSLWQPTWQQPVGTIDYCLEGLKAILPWLANIHVFNWDGDPEKRLFLSDGFSEWQHYIECIRSTNIDHHLMLEFVKDDSPVNFLKDAETLKSWTNNFGETQ